MRRGQRGGDAELQPIETAGRVFIPQQRGPDDDGDRNQLLLHLLPVSGQLEPSLGDEVPTLAGEWQVGAATVLLTTSGVVRILAGLPAECWSLHRHGLSAAEVVTTISARHGLGVDDVGSRLLPLLEVLPRVTEHRPGPSRPAQHRP